ncbi:hypothetical protein AKJ16_DCAP08573 [Drosera capensis]
MRGRRDKDEEFRSYFVLRVLWESFREWSVYGSGVPLLLNESDSVVRYYVPYLSAIQLYIDPSKPSSNIRRPGEESDGDSYSETSSDGSSDPDTGRGSNYFHGVLKLNRQDLTDATVQGIRELSVRSEPLNGSSSDEALASGFPDLKTCRSCDLSPASWVSVAWYPIYRTPTGTQNDRQGTFSSCPRETRNGFDMPVKLSLPSFGLAFYKFKISIWDQSGVGSDEVYSLFQAADEWLRRRSNVNHPDYTFLVSRDCNWRET